MPKQKWVRGSRAAKGSELCAALNYQTNLGRIQNACQEKLRKLANRRIRVYGIIAWFYGRNALSISRLSVGVGTYLAGKKNRLV